MTYRITSLILRQSFARTQQRLEAEIILNGRHHGFAAFEARSGRNAMRAASQATATHGGAATDMAANGKTGSDYRTASILRRLEGASFNKQREFDLLLEILEQRMLVKPEVTLILSKAFARAADQIVAPSSLEAAGPMLCGDQAEYSNWQ